MRYLTENNYSGGVFMSKKLPDISTQFAEWYNEVVYAAELADLAPVRGCIVIRPYGYALWENITAIVDKKIKDTGHHNAAFPLLIPQSFLQKEAEHVKGFSPELAVVTYAGGKELEEPLVVRPTSETIIHAMFAKWIKSWRDLPMKVNQWCSVVRWEMRTRPFLRTTEFWWQEGHTAHETAQEAQDEAVTMLNEYLDLIHNYLAIPAVPGRKPESEKFAGADVTYTMEALMPDGKALQMGTSHIISQNFAKAFGMTFQDRNGQLAYPYLTSWGATTRLIGALIMVHGDNKGLILPPKIAPIQVVIVPIFKTESDKQTLLQKADEIAQLLRTQSRVLCCSSKAAKADSSNGLRAGLKVLVDSDEHETPGAKFYKWELKGVPIRIEIGPRDLINNQVIIADRLGLAKEAVPFDKLLNIVHARLEQIQTELFKRAQERRDRMWHKKAKLNDFAKQLETEGGFYQTGWCRRTECEHKIKEVKATIRCELSDKLFEICFNCNNPSTSDILVAKAY